MLRKSTLEITGVSTAQNGRKEESWRFTVITPMIGGDAEQWKLNKEAPVRTQSVKGMLRFWWRALQESCNAEELLKREQRIWGGGQISDGRCSPIRIWIDQPGAGSVRWENPERPAYVYFPIVQSFKKPEDYKGVVAAAGFSFVLHASYPLNTSDNINYEKELHDTLLMWMLFGGVGARTRRGCGSLFCKELCDEYKIKNIKDILKKADIFAFPSAWEGFGLALTEAMSVGLPAIGYKSAAAVNELIENNKTGFLVNDGIEDFADKLNILIKDKDLRIKFGKNAVIAMQKYYPKLVYDKWETEINTVLNKFKNV